MHLDLTKHTRVNLKLKDAKAKYHGKNITHISIGDPMKPTQRIYVNPGIEVSPEDIFVTPKDKPV